MIAMDVLHLDRGVVDEHADGEREAAECHRVDRLPAEVERDERGQDRERDRDDHDQHAARRAEEHEHHERDENRRGPRLLDDVAQRGAHELRLIEAERDAQPARRGCHDVGDHRLHPVDDRERRRGGVLDDHQVRRALAVHTDDVRLHLVRVRDRRHVAERDRRAVDDLDRQRVEVLRGERAAVQLDRVLAIADLRRAGGNDDVRRRERVADVLRREAVRVERLRLQVHHHGAAHAAERRR